MTLDKRFDRKNKEADKNKKRDDRRRDKDTQLTKVVIRRLPATLTRDTFIEQISPLPDNDYFSFVKADASLGQNAFSRAYINFLKIEDIMVFCEKFDGYVFLDNKGNEFTAIVEFCPYQKIPKRKTKKNDSKKGTLEQDPEYLKFVESLQSPDLVTPTPPETFLEEIEKRDQEMKANHGVLKKTTPLIDYIRKRNEDKRNAILKAREDRKRRELERRKQREEDRRRRKDRDREKLREKERQRQHDRDSARRHAASSDKDQDAQPKVTLLRNPERDKSDKNSYGKDGSGDAKTADKDVKVKDYGVKAKDKVAAGKDVRFKATKEKERFRRDSDTQRVGGGAGRKTDTAPRGRYETDRKEDSGRLKGEDEQKEKDPKDKYGRGRDGVGKVGGRGGESSRGRRPVAKDNGHKPKDWERPREGASGGVKNRKWDQDRDWDRDSRGQQQQQHRDWDRDREREYKPRDKERDTKGKDRDWEKDQDAKGKDRDWDREGKGKEGSNRDSKARDKGRDWDKESKGRDWDRDSKGRDWDRDSKGRDWDRDSKGRDWDRDSKGRDNRERGGDKERVRRTEKGDAKGRVEGETRVPAADRNASPVRDSGAGRQGEVAEGGQGAGAADSGRKGSVDSTKSDSTSGLEGDREHSKGGRKIRYRDRPERAIYNPAQRAAERRRAQQEDSPRPDKTD